MKLKFLPSIMTVSTLASATTALVSCNSSSEVETTLGLDKHRINLEVNCTEQLTATVVPEDTTITWVSSDPSIATVQVENSSNKIATIIANNAGYAKITVKAGNKISECGITVTDPVIETDCVCIEATAPFTFQSVNGNHWKGETGCKVEYSTDGRNFSGLNGKVLISCTNKKIYIRGTGITSFGNNDPATSTTFKITGDGSANFSWKLVDDADIRTLLNYQDLDRAVMNDYCFAFLFKDNTSLSSIPNTLLPFETLTKYCYYGMFQGCTGITQISENLLSATALAEGCYSSMFKGSGLTTIPEGLLPITTLATHCYEYMFSNCNGLTSIPEGLLPATTLAAQCYQYMFNNCKGLTSIPEGLLPAGKDGVGALNKECYSGMFEGCDNTALNTIPANLLPSTKLSIRCYKRMFANCTGITQIPENLLPSSELDVGVYSSMFDGCTGLVEIPEGLLPTTTLAAQCYEYMFSNCNGLTTIPEGLLPAGKDGVGALAKACYCGMFEGCGNTALTSLPVNLLPAATLVESCYESMFASCSITGVTIGLLRATTLAQNCYSGMFENCSNITALSDETLPATNLSAHCYYGMFKGCAGLTTISENFLPAGKDGGGLANGCYAHMFNGCTGIETLPENLLSAEWLAVACYQSMFDGCSNLKTCVKLPAATLEEGCYIGIFANCQNLKIVEDEEPTSGSKIFTCPDFSGFEESPVRDMFSNTSGSFIGTPTEGKTYYWYE